MTGIQTKTRQVRNKRAAASPSEQTLIGPVFTPAAGILETDREITLLPVTR